MSKGKNLQIFGISAFFLVLLGLSFGCSKPETFFLGGIQVNEPDHSAWVQALKTNGMNTVAVTSYAHQGDWDSSNLWYSEKEEHVLSEIRIAKEKGLHVVLVLRVALDHAFPKNRFLWHGMIMPRTVADREEWFRRYTDFVLRWAKIAQTEKVDVLAVGSELNSMTSTVSLKELSPLIEYYLDQEQHQDRIEDVSRRLSFRANEGFTTRGDKSGQPLPEFLTEEYKAQLAWAKQFSSASGKDIPDEERLAEMNARRAELEGRWRKLIGQVRGEYFGKLAYAANFDQYHEVDFWDALDIIGVNAYFSLRRLTPDAVDADSGVSATSLQSTWGNILEEIDSLRQAKGLQKKPVIFTELGYTFRRHSTVEPWAMDGFSLLGEEDPKTLIFWKEQPLNFDERVLAIRALRQAHSARESKFLQGILYWKFSTIKSHLDIEPFVHILGDQSDAAFGKELVAFLGK